MEDIRVRWPFSLIFIRQFNKRFLRALDEAFIWKKKERRQGRASRLLGIDLAALGDSYHPGTILDVWLMPEDWRIGKVLNEKVMLEIADIRDDPETHGFLRRIAHYAITLP
jgi:hypothetical protein